MFGGYDTLASITLGLPYIRGIPLSVVGASPNLCRYPKSCKDMAEPAFESPEAPE